MHLHPGNRKYDCQYEEQTGECEQHEDTGIFKIEIMRNIVIVHENHFPVSFSTILPHRSIVRIAYILEKSVASLGKECYNNFT